jgi:hypothetical protein
MASMGNDAKLTILESPYRSFVEPVMSYLGDVDRERSHQFVTILIPCEPAAGGRRCSTIAGANSFDRSSRTASM